MSHRHKHPETSRWFFILASVLVIILTWQIVEPFVLVLTTAAIAAIILAPVDEWVRKYVKKPKLAAILTVIGASIVFLIPTLTILLLMIQQATEIVEASLAEDSLLRSFDLTTSPLFLLLPEIVQNYIVSIDIVAIGKSVASWLVDNLDEFFSSTANLVFKTFFFFISLYYFLSDRKKIHAELLALSPFKDKLDADIIGRLIRTVRGVVFGALIVAVVQAILGTIGMAFFGVPGSLLWGSLIIIAAQVPLLGVGLVMGPAILYLLITGNLGAALGLLIWSAVAVGLVDNLLSPYIVGGQTKLHAFLILIAILGGLQLFGPIGIVVGPTILAALMVIIDLYKSGLLEKSK